MVNTENVLKALKEKKQQNINSFKTSKVKNNANAIQTMIYYALLTIVFGSLKVYIEHLFYDMSKKHFPSFPLSPYLVLSYVSIINAVASAGFSILLLFALKKEKTKQIIIYSIMLLFCFIGMFS